MDRDFQTRLKTRISGYKPKVQDDLATKLESLAPKDKEAVTWALANPGLEQSKNILLKNGIDPTVAIGQR
jgi:hypothetical protein